jgi:hypothetical protein
MYDFAGVCSFLMDIDKSTQALIGQDDTALGCSRLLVRSLSAKAEEKANKKEDKLGPLCMVKFTRSIGFTVAISVVILLNLIYVVYEESARKDSDDSIAWFVVELLFTIIFVFEFICKIIAERASYFKDAWNNFDFWLCVFAVFGCVMDIAGGHDASASETTGIIRIVRVMKIARLLRFFRLFRIFRILYMKLDKHQLSLENGERMRQFAALTAYIKAHIHAQHDFMHYLFPEDDAGSFAIAQSDHGDHGDHGKHGGHGGHGDHGEHGHMGVDRKDAVMPVEMCKCILESQAFVYIAAILAVRCANTLTSKYTLWQIEQILESWDLTQEMSELVEESKEKGVLGGRDAEMINHPLHHHIEHCQMMITKVLQGYEMGLEMVDCLGDDIGVEEEQDTSKPEIISTPLEKPVELITHAADEPSPPNQLPFTPVLAA